MITSPLLSSLPYIQHGFFTRKGGASTGELDSLNLAVRETETRGNLIDNQQKILSDLGLTKFCPLKQVHGNRVTETDPDQTPEADAQFTTEPGFALSVITADCLPILFADLEKPIIAATHAGWRGLLQGVIEATAEALNVRGANNLIACIGPSIQQQSYEVGPEVHKQFTLQDATHAQFFKPSKQADHYLFDLPGLAKHLLTQLPNISGIDHIKVDTYSNPDLFFSCRRSAHLNHSPFGCQASVIGLRPAE